MPGFPAARMTDMHTCPICMGAPMPVLPPCCPTVLIGGLPAARQTDLCVCVGPPPAAVDMIAVGSPVVLIGGLPAAFMGAPTAKGGALLPPCCPTVLIGVAPMPVPAVPSASLLAPGGPGPSFRNPGEMDAPAMTEPRVTNPICVTLAAEAGETAAMRSDAMLAAAVYDKPGAPPSPLPPNTRRATQDDLAALGLYDGQNDMTKLKDSNFRSEVFVQNDPVTGAETYVVAFKGTDMTSLEDWGTNVQQGLGMETAYYTQANRIGQTATTMKPGQVRFVGHSLGGGLASSAAAMSGAEATTFNAAGLHNSTVERMGGALDSSKTKAVTVDGDILSAAQDNLPLRQAAGERKVLAPPPQQPGMVNRIVQAAGAAFGALMGGPLGGLLGAIGADRLLNGVNLHLMDQVIGAVDQEAGRIAAEQSKNGCK